MRDPEDCQNMTELREVIDALDRDLVALLACRQACIDRAAVLKAGEDLPARIPARVDEVLARVQAAAREAGLDTELAGVLWRQLIDWSIAREAARLGTNDGEDA